MSDGDYSEEEDYEYEYTDEEDDGPAEDISMDASQEDSVSDRPTDAPAKCSMPTKKPVDNPNAPPLSSDGKFDFDDESGIRLLPANELKPIMKKHVREAVEVLGVPPSAAAILMREHKWAKERLFQSFFDNPEKMQKKCGVLARCQNSGGEGKKRRQTVTAVVHALRRNASIVKYASMKMASKPAK